MMIASNAAADLDRSGLRYSFPWRGNALGRKPRVRTKSQVGLGTTLLEQSLAYKWWEHLTPATSVFVPTPEWTATYGPGGTYTTSPSVRTAEREEAAIQEAVYVAPNLYTTEACSPMDSACVARNDLVAQANQVLRDNANRLVFMANCQASGRGALCDQYRQVEVPPVPDLYGSARQKLPAIDNRSVIVGETPAQQQAAATAWEVQQRAITAQQAASAATGKPNQTVPPRPQPGEVAVGTGPTTAEVLAAFLAGQKTTTPQAPSVPFSPVGADGKIMGLEPMTLALIAAGVGALMLLKK